MATRLLRRGSWSHRLLRLGNPGGRRPHPRGDLKMYSQRFGIVQREVKGPTPKVVIVVSTRCVCGILPLSAPFRTPGLAEPSLAPCQGSQGEQGPDAVGWIFEEGWMRLLISSPCSIPFPLPPIPCCHL